MNYTIKEIQAVSILQKSGLPDADWVINPYTGCRFACKYCYAAFIGRFRHNGEEWGSYVDVKLNAPDILKHELTNKLAKQKNRDIGTIFMSSVTDPYQGLESKYKLTRQCLKVLIELKYTGKISILTKSHLVTRDIDLFKKLPNIEVRLTVTSTGDPISQYLETYASPHQVRLTTLKKLSATGIKTFAFVGPLLPHFVYHKKDLANLLKAIKATGVSYIYLEHINLSPYIRDRLFEHLTKDYPEEINKFKQALSSSYRSELDDYLKQITQKLDLPVAHQEAIYHQDKSSWNKLSKQQTN